MIVAILLALFGAIAIIAAFSLTLRPNTSSALLTTGIILILAGGFTGLSIQSHHINSSASEQCRHNIVEATGAHPSSMRINTASDTLVSVIVMNPVGEDRTYYCTVVDGTAGTPSLLTVGNPDRDESEKN